MTTKRDPDAQALIDAHTKELATAPWTGAARLLLIDTYTRAIDDAFKLVDKKVETAVNRAFGFPSPAIQLPLLGLSTLAQVEPPSDAQVLLDAHTKKKEASPSVSPQPEVTAWREGHLIPSKYPQLPPGTKPTGLVRRYPPRSLDAYSSKMAEKMLSVHAYYTDDVELFELGRCLNGHIRAYYKLKEGPGFALCGEWVYYHMLLGHLSMERLRGSRNARGEELRRQFHLLSTHIDLAKLDKADEKTPKVEE